MKVLPFSKPCHVLISYQVALLLLSVICLICSGCFSGREHSAWREPTRSGEKYAILPVLPAHVRITVEKVKNPYGFTLARSNVKNRKEAADTINKVLGAIAAGKNNQIVGPKEFDAELKSSPNWKHLSVYIQDPGPLQEPWKREGLTTISREIGYQWILCIKPTVLLERNMSWDDISGDKGKDGYEFDPLGWHWKGKIRLRVDLLDLTAAKAVANCTKEAQFHGHAGVLLVGGGVGSRGVVFPIPYAFGRSFERAVDQAIRQALIELCAVSFEGGTAQ